MEDYKCVSDCGVNEIFTPGGGCNCKTWICQSIMGKTVLRNAPRDHGGMPITRNVFVSVELVMKDWECVKAHGY